MASGESRRSVAAWIVFVVVLGAIFLGAGACTSAREEARPSEDAGVRNPRASNGAGAPWTETPSGFVTVSSGTRLRVGRDGAIHVGDGIEFRSVDASSATLEGDRVSVRGTGSTGEFGIAPGGVERTWSFASMPEGSDDVEVRLHVRGGKLLREDGEGVHFVPDSTGPAPTARRERAVVGHGTWIDARGVRTAVKARHEDGDVVFRVARSTVASSRFPAVLDPVIGPDLTLGGPATAPYYGDHGMADVAWNGTNYLVVWLAVRGSLPAGLMAQTFDAAGVATSAPQQLQASGSVGTLVQIRVIASGTNFAVATLSRAGVSSYLATWALQGNGNSVNGSSLASIYIGSDVTGIDMAASPTEVFVVWDTPTTAPGISGRRYVASTMSPYSTTTETLAAGTVGNTKRPRISWNGTHFLVVWTRTFGTNDDIEGVRYLPGTGVVGTNPIAISKRAEGEVDPVVASNGAEWLVGWRVTGATPRVKTARVSAAGLVLDTVPVVHGTSPVVGSTSLVWTGTNYVLGFADSTGPSGTNVSAFRITAGGATVGTSPARFGTTTVGTDPFALAAGPAHVFATWTTGTPGSRGVTGRRMAFDGTFPEAQGTLLTQGAVSRNFPAVAWNGSRYLVAWNETRTFSGNILWVAAVAPTVTLATRPASRSRP
ncbi:MAG: hypothetical protein U0169_22975 [Polyangiaceae bacterium]